MHKFFSPLEKILIVLLSLIVLATGFYLVRRFVAEHSEVVAGEGGIFTEGLIGRPFFLNPLLLNNPVDRDISQLIFSGLTRYNPHSGQIEDDLATSERSKDNLQYTFTILPDARWHDGTAVSSDDIVFTYETLLQNPGFPNTALKQAFQDIVIEKLTPKSVRFKLKKPYSFFLSNVTIGILPKHLLKDVPPENLEQSEFRQNPVGTGPYRFSGWTVSQDTQEITLERNEEYYGIVPKIQNIVFRVFSDQASLLRSQNTLTGFRLSGNEDPETILGGNSRFANYSYFLPQYSALFFNTDSDVLVNRKVRLALSLATNVLDIHEKTNQHDQPVRTPLMESKSSSEHLFDLEKAKGALFDSNWHLPEKLKNLEKPPVQKASLDAEESLAFEISATADSWISYRIDDAAIDSILLKKGQNKILAVKKSLLLTTIGNAGGITLMVNGVLLRPLGGSGEVVKNILLDRTTLPKFLEKPLPIVEEKPKPPITAMPSLPDSELNRVRMNTDGKRLVIRLVTAQDPPFFLKIAELAQKQWLEIGVKVIIESYPMADLQEKIQKRDYDVLLFGQNLGYNLDAFPFWHSSQAFTGLNLSNFRNLEADNLLVDIRKIFDERTKQDLLARLKKLLDEEIPAVFLFNPIQYYFTDSGVKNVNLLHLSSNADRLNDLPYWYMKEDYKLRQGSLSLIGILKWLFTF